MNVLTHEAKHSDGPRVGLWRCKKCLAWLTDSLDIAVHLGQTKSAEYPKATRCAKGATKDDILFVCREHGLEKP